MCWGVVCDCSYIAWKLHPIFFGISIKLLIRISGGCGAVPLDVDGMRCTGNFNDSCEQEMDVPLQLGDNERKVQL